MELQTKIFPNKYKTADQKDAKKPDFTSTTQIDGIAHDFAMWRNDDGSFSLKIKPKETR